MVGWGVQKGGMVKGGEFRSLMHTMADHGGPIYHDCAHP